MAKRGRPAGSGKKKPTAPTSDGEERPNGGPPELTDDQLAVLLFKHKKSYEKALAEKKRTANDFLAVCNLAKADLGDDAIPSIKDALLLETDEGQAKMEAAIARQARVARWMAVPLGAQPDFFNTDMAPATNRAFDAGKAARLKGEPLKPPHDPSVPQHDKWISGWHEGERLLNEAQRRDDAAAFGPLEAKEVADAVGDGMQDAYDAATDDVGDDDALAELVDAAEEA